MRILKNPLIYYCVNGMYYIGVPIPDVNTKHEQITDKLFEIRKYTIFPICIALYISMLTLEFIDFFSHLDDLKNITFNGILSFFFLVSLTKLSIVLRKGCQYLFTEIYEKTTYDDQWDPNEIEIIKNGVTDAMRANRYQWLLYTSAFISASVPNLILIFATGEVTYPIKLWEPFDMKSHLYFGLVFEIVMALPSTIIAALFEALILNFIIHAIIQLRVLQYKFQQALSEKNYEESKLFGRLSKCIRLHQDIAQYVHVLNDLIYIIMLLVFLFYMGLFCGTGFQLLVVPIVSIEFAWISVFLMTKILELFILYSYGSKLHDESLKVADKVFESEWYLLPAKHNKKLRSIILIIIMRAQKPLHIKVGPCFTMSMEMYTSAIRTAYSLLTFLRNFI